LTSAKQPRRRKVPVYGDFRIKWAYVKEEVRSPLNTVAEGSNSDERYQLGCTVTHTSNSNSVSKMAFRGTQGYRMQIPLQYIIITIIENRD